jgi:16S rRNA processing protein RimM
MKPISELTLIKIGEIQKSRGFKGELLINLDREITLKKETEYLFLEIDGYRVPFFFSDTPKMLKNGITVTFDNVTNERESAELIGCSVFTSEKNISKPKEKGLGQFKGYTVFNDTSYIGIASGYLNIPSNPILEVIAENGTEILIPFHEAFVVNIDKSKKKLTFKLPEGLTDINRM